MELGTSNDIPGASQKQHGIHQQTQASILQQDSFYAEIVRGHSTFPRWFEDQKC